MMALNFCPNGCKAKYAFSVSFNLPSAGYGALVIMLIYTHDIGYKYEYRRHNLLDFSFYDGIIYLTCKSRSLKGGCHAKRESEEGGRVAD